MTTPVGGTTVEALGTDGAATTGAWVLGGGAGADGAAGLKDGGAAGAVKSLKAATSSLVGTMTHSACNDITTAVSIT